MATVQASGQSDEVVRPFQCSQCGSRYTRQEHLSRHQQARHSDVKEFVCSVCGKGFARRDILRRHELGHQRKADGGSPAQKIKRESGSRKRAADADNSGDYPPPKASRSARACLRCSKSKLRCDGELPCARCKRAGSECTFDRTAVATPASSVQGDVSHSNAASDDDELESQLDDDDSAEDETYVDNSRGASPAAQWSHGGAQAVQAPPPPVGPMSPYGGVHRPSPLHQSSLPPSSFHHQQQQPMNMGSPSYYHSRPPDPFYRTHSPYQQMAAYAAQPPPASFSAPGAVPPLPAPVPTKPSPWDTAAYGRTSTSTGDPGLGQVDFLDLIAGASSSNDGSDIDWTLLNSGYTPRSDNFTPSRAHDDAVDGAAIALAGISSPNAMDVDPSGGQSIQQQSSSLRHSLDDPAAGSTSADKTAESGNKSASGTTQKPGQNQESASALAIQGSAAETLLQLASHTPRGSPEPEHRTSHPVHNLSDPWPLSYRPTEKTERLDKGASRAASPRPGAPAAPQQPQHVPAVSATTRARVIDKVREIGEAERFVPRLELLDMFVQLYFDRFSPLLPMLHKPTFDPNACPSFLLLAVASVGARYAYDRVVGAKMHGQALTEIARRMYQSVSETDNTLVRTVGWQQAMILILFTGLASGNKRDLERAQAFSSMPITFSRRQGWFKEPKVDESHERTFSIEERWKRWRDREEIKRLGFTTLVFDSMSTALWNHECSALYMDAAKTTLPCHDALWDAPNAVAWQALFKGSLLPPKGLETLAAVRLATDNATHSAEALVSTARDSLAMMVVLGTLHSLGWTKNHASNMTALFMPAASVQANEVDLKPFQSTLETGLQFFQDHVLLPPELQSLSLEPNATMSTLALLVHFTCMTQHLPLRVLQPLARVGEWGPSPDIFECVHAWAQVDGGRVARQTVFHAGQLLALCRSSPSDSPLEPFALFYAALVVLSFVRELPTTIALGNGVVKNENAVDGATQPPTPTLSPDEPRYQLDRLVDRRDLELEAWLQGSSNAGKSAWVTDVGELDAKGAGIRVLRTVSKSLISLKVWKVGELLGRTLIELANDEERKASMARQMQHLQLHQQQQQAQAQGQSQSQQRGPA